MKKIYFVGGSPCAGKSTICEIISKKYNLCYFKVDDYLEKYMKKVALNNETLCKKNLSMTTEEIWMRNPTIQKDEEFGIYKEIFDDVINDLEKINCDNAIITEGCAYLPTLIKELGFTDNKYLAIIPTKEFQVTHYQERQFVPYVLDGCSNKEKAFENWMERDFLFSKEIERQCESNKLKIMINDGTTNLDDMVNEVVTHFGID